MHLFVRLRSARLAGKGILNEFVGRIDHEFLRESEKVLANKTIVRVVIGSMLMIGAEMNDQQQSARIRKKSQAGCQEDDVSYSA